MPFSLHTIGEINQPTRLLDYCIGRFVELPSRNSVKKALKEGRILLDGEVAEGSRFVQPGQSLSIQADESKPAIVLELPLEVVFEDDYLAVVNKPAGLPTSGNQHRTLAHALPFNLKPTAAEGSLPVPLPVHRLDYGTSGLVLVAKTREMRARLGQMLEDKEISKFYLAICMGQAVERGELHTPVNGQQAHSSYRLLKTVSSLRSGHLSLLELQPHTGRTHQLRIQLAEAGLPILGDRKYGPEGQVLKGKGLFLSAVRLEFTHPLTGKACRITINPPAKFQKQLTLEEARWRKFKEN